MCTSTEEAEEAPASSFFIFSRYIYRLTEKRVWRELERGRGGESSRRCLGLLAVAGAAALSY